MKNAYSVVLINSVRKTEDPKDISSFQTWINESRFYSKDSDRVNGLYPKTVRLARPMTKGCAEKLVSELRGAAQKIEVVEIIADDDEFLPETLAELRSPANEPLGITALKSAVEHCLKSGMLESEVVEITRSEVFGTARLRAAVQECLTDKKVKDEDILTVVTTAVQG